MVRLKIDFEFSSRVWWKNGGQALWNGIAEVFDDNSILVEENIASSWLAKAKFIEGWNEGTDYAPHPVVVVDAGDDVGF